SIAAGTAAAEAVRPDLAFVDLNLPDGDGTEMLRRLRRDPAAGGVVIVALSAHAAREMAETAMRDGFDDYLTKPFDIRAIRRYVARRAALLDEGGVREAEPTAPPQAAREASAG
ncbi:MAG: response regulator, partial [Alphaproteobacteria bacterium]